MTGGMFLNLMGVQNLAIAFRHIQSGLGAGPDEVSWIITSFLIAEVVMLAMSGWLLRVLSIRWMFTMCAGGFTVGSILCALAWDINSAVAFRAVQGLFGGGIMPCVFSVMFTHYRPEARDRVSMLVGLFATAASALGPILGGFIAESLSWRWIFLSNVPFGIVVTVLGASLGRYDSPETGLWKRADLPGIVLAILVLGPGLIVLEEGRRADWFASDLITSLTAVSAIALLLFLVRELTCKNPVVDLSVFKTRNFALGSAVVFCWGVVLFAPAYLLPVFLARVRLLDSIVIGQMVFVLGAGQFLSGFITLALFRIWPRRIVALVGILMMGTGTLMQGFMFAGPGFWDVFPAQTVRGLAAAADVSPDPEPGARLSRARSHQECVGPVQPDHAARCGGRNRRDELHPGSQNPAPLHPSLGRRPEFGRCGPRLAADALPRPGTDGVGLVCRRPGNGELHLPGCGTRGDGARVQRIDAGAWRGDAAAGAFGAVPQEHCRNPADAAARCR